MKYSVTFCVLSAVCAVYAFQATQHPLLRIVFGWIALCALGLGAAFGPVGPRAFGKRGSGALSPLSYLLFGPYHLLNHPLLLVFRALKGKKAVSRIEENLYLGCRLSPGDKRWAASVGIHSVLDLTAEFSETGFLRGVDAYRCIPLLDTTAPTPKQLQDGAAWIQTQLTKGPVFVHCALGHGRSATFVAAYLLLARKADSAAEAITHIRAARPGVELNADQAECLRRWEQAR